MNTIIQLIKLDPKLPHKTILIKELNQAVYKYINLVEKYLKNKNIKKVKIELHNLKGLYSNLKIKNLYNQIRFSEDIILIKKIYYKIKKIILKELSIFNSKYA